MAQKVPMKCNCRASNWCQTKTCACIKAEVKCSIACHKSGGHPDTRVACQNASDMRNFISKGLRSRDIEEQEKRERQSKSKEWLGRKAKGWAWVVEEDNDAGDDDDGDKSDVPKLRKRQKK